MRQTVYTYLWVMLLTVLIAVGCNRQPLSELMQADAVMESRPDSALAILDALDTTWLSRASDRALYALLLTQARTKEGEIITADTLINRAVDYYSGTTERQKLMRSLFYQADILSNIQELSKASISSTKAYEIATQIKDNYWEAKTAEQVADIFTNSYIYDNALHYRKQALYYYYKSGKQRNVDFSRIDYGIALYNVERYPESEALLSDALSDAVAKRDSVLEAYAARALLPVYVRLNDKEQSARCFNILKRYSDVYHLRSYDYLYMAEIESDKGNYNNALNYITYAEDLDPDIKAKLKISYLKYKCNLLGGDVKNAACELDSTLEWQNEVVEGIIRQPVGMALQDLRRQQAVELSKRNNRLIHIICGILLGVVCLVNIGLLAYRIKMQYKDLRIKKQMLEILTLNDKLETQTQLNDEIKQDKELLQSRLNMADATVEELKIKVTDKEIYMREYEEALQNYRNKELSQTLKSVLSYKSVAEAISEYFIMYIDSSSYPNQQYRIVTELEKKIKEIGTAKNLKLLETSINNSLDNIIVRLKEQCDINDQSNIKFLILCIAGFRPRVIAYILGMPDKTFYSKRDRIIARIRKLGLENEDEFIIAIKPAKE